MTSFWTILFIIISFCPTLAAQNSMRIHQKDGTYWDVPVAQIDSISFIDTDTLTIIEAELEGSWLWANAEQDYYELLTFNKDKTYTGYDNYFTYGFDTMTYGFYSHYGAMLTMWSNGFGYSRRFNWYVIGLSENAFEVMTKMGPFTYYKLQQNNIQLKVGDYLLCNEDESYIFADGVVAGVEENKLYGIKHGTTYILKKIAKSDLIYAYKVIVE